MSQKFSIILFAFVSFLFIGCKHPCSDRDSSTPKKIIVFLDVVKGNERIFLNHFMPKIESLIRSNKSSKNLFSLEVYPITKESSGEEALVKYTLTEDKSNKICQFQNQDNIQISEIKQQFHRQSEIFKTRDTTLSVLYTIPLLSERLSSIEGEEKVYVIYLSDLVELHNPANEDVGYFSFLEPGTNTIDIISIEIAQDQIKNELSEIGKIITRCEKDINDCNIIAFKPNSIIVNPDEHGNRRFKIDDFWRGFFGKLGTSIKINQLSDLDDGFEFK